MRVHGFDVKTPVLRYEEDKAGELLHLDMKKLARFQKPGRKVTGDNKNMNRQAGYDILHVPIDDHSQRFRNMLGRLKIKHKKTTTVRKQMGKAERVIQTLLREWAYAFSYPSSEHRKAELGHWLLHHNFSRPHSDIHHLPPASRIGFDVNNVLRNYS